MKLKRIKLKKLKNTRDLGYFPAADNRVIKPKKLIRSGYLGGGTTEDISRLIKEYNLKTVIDLRADAEVKEKPENLPEGIEYIRFSLIDNSYLGIARDEYSIMSWFNLFKDTNRDPEEVFYDMYEMLVFSERTKKLIRGIFDVFLEDRDGSVLWHCSAGKDRVGIITMLILLALNVDRDLIIRDFLATNRFSIAHILKTVIFSPLVIRERRLRKCLVILMTVKRMYMERLLDRIENDYSSREEFFEKQYGILSEEIEKLRDKYLMKKRS